MKRYRLLLVFGVLVSLSSLAIAILHRPSVEARISTLIERAGSRTFAIADATAFPWDRLFVFPPYASPETIRGVLGFAWDTPPSARIESRDDIALLVFVHAGQVVAHSAQPRRPGDFALVPVGPFSRATAIFRVVPRKRWPQLQAVHPSFAAEQRRLIKQGWR